MKHSASPASDRMWLVALAAALWGTSALLREPLLERGLSPTLIVLCEHVVLTLCLAPWLASAIRCWLGASARTRISVLTIGAGSSALATTLFTAAFALGDPITPQVLQKLQPVLALLLAAVLVGERLSSRFWLFAVPSLGGSWLLAFSDPLAVDVDSVKAAAYAVGAAALWGAGTVLGRIVSSELEPVHVTALRFAVGLVAMTLIVTVRGDWRAVPIGAMPSLALLALVPGLLALLLYYRGLSATPASRATLAELAFPVTAAIVGVFFLHGSLAATQWLGGVIVLASVTGLALHEQVAARPAVPVPNRLPEPTGS